MDWKDNDKIKPKKCGLYLVWDSCSEGRTMNTLWFDSVNKVWNRCVQPLKWIELPLSLIHI